MEKIIYEYSLLRYVPDLERGEFINVGLMMMCKRRRWLCVRTHIDEDRIRTLAPDADLRRLRCQLGAFCREDVPFPSLPVEERYRWMAAVKSAVVQTSPSHPGIVLADAEADVSTLLADKFEDLYGRLVLTKNFR